MKTQRFSQNGKPKSLTKKSSHSNYALFSNVPYVLVILVTCSGHRFFLHVSCLKSLSITYVSSYPHVPTAFFIIEHIYESNMLKIHSSFWPFNNTIKSKGYDNSVSTKKLQYTTNGFKYITLL